MFDEIPVKGIYRSDPYGDNQIRNYDHMLKLINHLIETPPPWSTTAQGHGTVGLPINAVL